MNTAAEAILDEFEELGLQIVGSYNDESSVTVVISVPEFSYKSTQLGTELEALGLARRFRRTVNRYCSKELIVRCKVRPGDYWSRVDEINL